MTITVRSLEGYSADVWANLPWRLFEKRLVRLQRRIHKASKVKNTQLVKDLQHLLLGSNSARYLAVRYVIESSIFDKKYRHLPFRSLTSKQRIRLVQELKYPRISKFKDLHNVIVKSFEDYIYTLKRLSLQCLFKYITEPVSEFPSLHYFYKGRFINSFHYFKTNRTLKAFLDFYHSCWSGKNVSSFLKSNKIPESVFDFLLAIDLSTFRLSMPLIKVFEGVDFNSWYFKKYCNSKRFLSALLRPNYFLEAT